MISTVIRDLCKKNKISIRKLEVDLGFSAGSASKWDDSSPSFDRVVKICDYFGITLDDFYARVKECGKEE